MRDREIRIATAGMNCRLQPKWKNKTLEWSAFADSLTKPIRSEETYEAYKQMTKAEQDALKDVGGFIGGPLKDGIRKEGVLGRELVSIDLDSIPAGKTEEIKEKVAALNCAALIYSTRNYTERAPRLRVVIPLDRMVSCEEYTPIARKLTEKIGLEYSDPTTFQASRLMYMPSVCQDAPYIYQRLDGEMIAADAILGEYTDWRNAAEWPQLPGQDKIIAREQKKQQDPLTKAGIIGAFCRTYTIQDAIAKYIPETYTPGASPDRMTYAQGHTTNGAVIYDDKFLYSNHATDPASQVLCNAFDLIRLHLFGDQDTDYTGPTNRAPSYKAMAELARKDEAVMTELKLSKNASATDDFATQEMKAEVAIKLTADITGEYELNIKNFEQILQTDAALKDAFKFDTFTRAVYITRKTPWNETDTIPRELDNSDLSGLTGYIEANYNMYHEKKLDHALRNIAMKHKINEVEDYLKALEWDGIPRADTLFIDYLGARDNNLNRKITGKWLVAAVARGIQGGVKFDCVPILSGKQGIGKSLLLKTLAKKWFADSDLNFDRPKEAAEKLQGVWIYEIGELTGMNRSEMTAIKQFISSVEDRYRPAYAKVSERFTRRCVFAGTTNETEYLRDSTGNRRFWPIDLDKNLATKDVLLDLPGAVDQIWAEAYARWQFGEDLEFDQATYREAAEQQEAHMEFDPWEGIIEDFLQKPVLKDWYKKTFQEQQIYINADFPTNAGAAGAVPRDRVCPLEIWLLCFGRPKSQMSQKETRRITRAIARLKNWNRDRRVSRFGEYGVQLGYTREDPQM